MLAQSSTTSPPAMETRKAWDCRDEPSIAEIMDDPVMHQMMRGDHVEPAALLGLMAEMRERLGAGM